jgi:putative membrane protein
MMWGDGMGGGMGWMWLFWLLLVVGTVVLVVVLVKLLTGNSGGGTRQGGSASPPTGAGAVAGRQRLPGPVPAPEPGRAGPAALRP